MTRFRLFELLVGTEEHWTRLSAPRKDIRGQAEWRIAVSLRGTVTGNVKDRAPHGMKYKKRVRQEEPEYLTVRMESGNSSQAWMSAI
jgi:hypothetical protein